MQTSTPIPEVNQNLEEENTPNIIIEEVVKQNLINKEKVDLVSEEGSENEEETVAETVKEEVAKSINENTETINLEEKPIVFGQQNVQNVFNEDNLEGFNQQHPQEHDLTFSQPVFTGFAQQLEIKEEPQNNVNEDLFNIEETQQEVIKEEVVVEEKRELPLYTFPNPHQEVQPIVCPCVFEQEIKKEGNNENQHEASNEEINEKEMKGLNKEWKLLKKRLNKQERKVINAYIIYKSEKKARKIVKKLHNEEENLSGEDYAESALLNEKKDKKVKKNKFNDKRMKRELKKQRRMMEDFSRRQAMYQNMMYQFYYLRPYYHPYTVYSPYYNYQPNQWYNPNQQESSSSSSCDYEMVECCGNCCGNCEKQQENVQQNIPTFQVPPCVIPNEVEQVVQPTQPAIETSPSPQTLECLRRIETQIKEEKEGRMTQSTNNQIPYHVQEDMTRSVPQQMINQQPQAILVQPQQVLMQQPQQPFQQPQQPFQQPFQNQMPYQQQYYSSKPINPGMGYRY